MRELSFLGIIGLIGCAEKEEEEAVNHSPEIISLEIQPAEGITTSTSLLCWATASDIDNDLLNLSFQWTDADGNLLHDSDESELTPDITQPEEELICTVTVTEVDTGTTVIESHICYCREYDSRNYLHLDFRRAASYRCPVRVSI